MKGFTKDGKFRPTGNRNKSSLKKSDIQDKIQERQDKKSENFKKKYNQQENETAEHFMDRVKHGVPDSEGIFSYGKVGRDKKTLEPKLDSRVEEYFDYGNSEEQTIWKVKGIDARPDFDGKVVPVEFFINTVIDETDFSSGEDKNTYLADLVMVPKKYGKKKWQEIIDSVGSGNDKENEETANMFDAISSGEYLDIRQTGGNSAEEAINKLMENIQADAGLIGFVLDRQINGMGEDGWDRIAELALDRPFERRGS